MDQTDILSSILNKKGIFMLEAFKNLDKKQKIWISIVVIIYLIILVISIKIILFPKTDKLENEMT